MLKSEFKEGVTFVTDGKKYKIERLYPDGTNPLIIVMEHPFTGSTYHCNVVAVTRVGVYMGFLFMGEYQQRLVRWAKMEVVPETVTAENQS